MGNVSGISLIQAQTEGRIVQAGTLFKEYAATLGFDLSFQDFDRELAGLPGEYAPPGGRLLLAREGEAIVGCVTLRESSPGVCELKRLYVRPGCRGKGIGRLLAEAAVKEARQIGYRAVRLDTVPGMSKAIALYESMGFQDIEPYRNNPVPGARYMQLTFPAESGPG